MPAAGRSVVDQPRPEDVFDGVRSDPGASVVDLMSSSPSASPCGDGDPGAVAALRRVDRVVDQVAQDGDQVARRQRAAAPSSMRLSSASTSSTPRSFACAALPSSSAASTGSPTAPTTWSVRAWASSSSAVANSTASVRPAQLDQRDHGVQPVGRLVRLGAQRLGEAALGVQLAGQRLELGVVAQGDHRAAAARRRTTGRVFTTTTRSAVRCTSSTRGSAASSAPVSGVGSPSSATQRPTAFVVETQQFPAAVVDQGDPAPRRPASAAPRARRAGSAWW